MLDKVLSNPDIDAQEVLWFLKHPECNGRDLKEVFSERVDLFGEYIFAKHITLSVPQFHKDIYSFLQRPEKTKGIAAPRGFAKSTIVDLIYAAWCIAYGKKHHIIILSDSYTQAVEFVNTLADEIEHNERFRILYGSLKSQKWAEGEFETLNEVRVTAKGLGMKIRGLKYKQYRPDLLIVDDLENDEAVSSVTQRKKLKRYFLRGVLPALARDGEAIVIGTILHWDSLLKKIVEHKDEFGGWTTCRYQALSQDDTGQAISLWPEAWPVDVLQKMRSDPTYPKYLGSIVFEQEYQNNPRSEEDSIFQPDWIQFYDDVPAQFETIVTSVDPAISEKETADFSAITTWGTLTRNGQLRFYCLDAVNKHLNFPALKREVELVDARFKPRAVLVESVMYQKALKQSLEGVPAIEVYPDKDKVRRALTVQPIFEAGQVYLRRNQIDLYDELTQFTGVGDAHDDLVDSTVYALSYLKGSQITFFFGDSEFKAGEKVVPKTEEKVQEPVLAETVEQRRARQQAERKEQERKMDLEVARAQQPRDYY